MRHVPLLNIKLWTNICNACNIFRLNNRGLRYRKDQNCENDSGNCFSSADFETLELLERNFKIYQNFVSEDEETELMKEIDLVLKRRRYQFDHWDGAIKGYKETEKLEWNELNSKVLQRLRELAFPENTAHITSVHVLDLAKSGHIKPHIDSIRFCGDTISGISLLSSSLMRLTMEQNKCFVDVLLPRRSLYVMKGTVRYDFTHEILDETSSYFKGKLIARDRRVSVICRNQPESGD